MKISQEIKELQAKRVIIEAPPSLLPKSWWRKEGELMAILWAVLQLSTATCTLYVKVRVMINNKLYIWRIGSKER